MADATTVNYGWTKPNVNDPAGADQWGGKLNADLDGIDSTVKSVSNIANAAAPLASPTFTGTVTLAADPAAALQPVTKQYFDARPMIGDNRIINGDCRVDQRNNGATGIALGYTIDRWQFNANLTTKGTWGRNIGSLGTPPGFPYYLGWSSNGAYTPAAGDYFSLQQKIEADMVSDFAWGGAGAQPVTLSFWAMSNLVGTFSGSIENAAGTRSYPFTYSLPGGSGNWTKCVVNIPPDTTGTWVLSGNAASVLLTFDLGSGSTFEAPAGAWFSGNAFRVPGAASCTVSNKYLMLTGVKLEIGSVATSYDRQSLAKSQADCERYFRWLPFNISGVATGAGQIIGSPAMWSQMRASPTIGAPVADPNTTPVGGNNSANTFTDITPYGALMYVTSGAAGPVYLQGYRSSASAEL